MTTLPTDLPDISFGFQQPYQPLPVKPTPLSSLVASARRIKSETLQGRPLVASKSWQEDAWEMFDLVGEFQYLTTTLAGRLSQARLYVGRRPRTETDEPEPVDDLVLQAILESFGRTTAGRSQLMKRMAVNLSVAGDGWFVGIPPRLLPASEQPHDIDDLGTGGWTLEDTDASEIQWRMMSVTEVKSVGVEVELSFGEGSGDKVLVSPDDLYLVRVWHPHPRRHWEAGASSKSSLPVLRELVGLTMKIAAQVDSRLAGAGVLLVPQSARNAILAQMGLPLDTEEDPFTEALMEAMLTPIQDRTSAAAVVPLVLTVPDDAVDKFKHLSFLRPADDGDAGKREESIRRLAMSQDAPPELLLGTAGMNHWGGWLVREDVISTHIEPPLALICDALTTQFLWPVLNSLGYEDFEQYVVWYDVSHLVTRPNRTNDALVLHERSVIGDAALRYAAGFDEQDAPYGPDVDLAGQIVLGMLTENPSLATSPGVGYLLGQVRGLLDNSLDAQDEPAVPAQGTETDADADADAEMPADGGPPDSINPADAVAGPMPDVRA